MFAKDVGIGVFPGLVDKFNLIQSKDDLLLILRSDCTRLLFGHPGKRMRGRFIKVIICVDEVTLRNNQKNDTYISLAKMLA